MQVVFSAVHYVHDYNYVTDYLIIDYLINYIMTVIMQVTVSVVAMHVTVSGNNFMFLSLTDTHFS